ncbi:hypothetical protein FRC09_000298 [Ceratobasidium sp. 395]|nr:hypothetical protein FRC09_000298 [Ceratobasidium sp. 395]
MTDPSAMERRIAQAQLAVLCPNEDPNRFLTIDPTKFKASQGFTNNSVIVDVSGQEQADLNFVDLPGLIVNVSDGGEAGHIDQVQQMVRGYISKPNTIILLVVSCNTDYETQGAGILAAEFDKKGERTVGVLTKPDRIESSEDAAQWTSMISGKVNRLANGWFAVKQPDSKQRKSNLTWNEARDVEAEFFETHEAWAAIAPEHRGRLGSANLAYQLGNILSAALESRFAELRIEIDRIMRETSTKLRQFPGPSSVPPSELIQGLLADFFNDIRIQMVEGDPSAEEAGVIQTLRLQTYAFRERLQTVVPVFSPRDSAGVRAGQEAKFLHESERWLLDSPFGVRYTIDAVEYRCRGAILRETGDFGSFDPTRYYMNQVSQEWAIHALDLLDEGYDVLYTKLSELVGKHFSKYSYGGLYSQVGDLAYELLRQCKEKTETQIKYLAAQESYPRTFHDVLYTERKCAYQEHFKTYGANEPALTTMARTLALFEVAFRRFTDMVPLAIDLHFVNNFGNLVAGQVTTKLNLLRDEAELLELLRVSDPMIAQRDALSDKLERLREARSRLSSW